MPVDRSRPGETREMRLVGRVIALYRKVPDASLPEFIARRRTPGEMWRTWDELSFELAEVIDEVIGARTLNMWAKRYGIPEDTEATGDEQATASYVSALTKANIAIS